MRAWHGFRENRFAKGRVVSPLSRRNLLRWSASATVAAFAGQAAVASAQPMKLSLANYELTFSDEFNDARLSMPAFSARWYAHTPWWGDFGDAQFVDAGDGFPFTLHDGCLRIEARKDATGKWRSGLISSTNHELKGFAQLYGYFEVRAKLPPGPGVWPAFWLAGMVPAGSVDDGVEIDVLEYYGQNPDEYHSTVVVWPHDKSASRSKANIHKVQSGSLSQDFHTFGVSVEPDFVIHYMDGVETWRVPTPIEHKHPLAVLVNLALGSGWPIKDTVNPSYMYLDYVRVYRKTKRV